MSRRISNRTPVPVVSPDLEPVAGTYTQRSLSFSEYSDYYEHRHAATRTIAAVRDAAPTMLEWEIGS